MTSLTVFAITKVTKQRDQLLATINEAIDKAADENDTASALHMHDVSLMVEGLDKTISLAWDKWCEQAWSRVVANPFSADGDDDSLVMNA